MNKLFLITICLLASFATYGQKRFPKFTYTTITGDTISNSTLQNKSTLIIVGHISCPAMLFLIKDLQKASIDTIQVILLLENTKEQAVAFNSNDTNDIWGFLRYSFKIQKHDFATVTFCERPKIDTTGNAIRIKNQCNKLKVKYKVFESPKVYAINNSGRIINTQTGWYLNLPDPKKEISSLFHPH